jgi:hypothetical protein
MTFHEMIDLTVSVYECHASGKKWLRMRVPDLVSFSCYEEFVERGLGQGDGDGLFGALVKVLGYFLPHFGLFQALDNRDTMQALASSGLEFPPLRACFEKVVGFCLDRNWGGQIQGRVWFKHRLRFLLHLALRCLLWYRYGSGSGEDRRKP